MVDAFIYMYIVCLGGSMGIATTTFIGWKIYNKQNGRTKATKRLIA